jgi:hypothetical protein
MVRIGARPPTGALTNYAHWLDVKLPGVAPWHAGAWRLKQGGIEIDQGTTAPFFNRTDNAFFQLGFSRTTPLPTASDYSLEMDINRSGSPVTLSQTGLSFAFSAVQAVDLTSLTPTSNYYFKKATPTFSWGSVSDANSYYCLRVYEPRGGVPLYTSAWSQSISATVPAGVLKAGGTYLWTVMTTPTVATPGTVAMPGYVIAYTDTEANTSGKALFRFTIQPPLMGDVSGNGEVNLEDAVLALQVVSGFTPTVTLTGDVNADNRIGLPEAIYILQEISGLR